MRSGSRAGTSRLATVRVGGPTESASLAGAFNAMLEGVRQRETQLTFRALHDPLATLDNRTLLDEQLRGALSRLHRSSESRLALLFLDLDGFKRINDTLGPCRGRRDHSSRRTAHQGLPSRG